MKLLEYIISDLARKRKPTLRNFVLEYLDLNGDNCFRFAVWLRLVQKTKSDPLLKWTIGVPIYWHFHHMEKKMGIYVNTNIPIGKGFSVVHPGCIFLNCGRIGEHFTVYQNVTLGARPGREGVPMVGDHVTVYPGSVVCGDVNIHDHARIDANSYVDKDVPEGAVTRGAKTTIT